MTNDQALELAIPFMNSEQKEQLYKVLFEISHPIGSYLQTENTADPSTYLVGGGVVNGFEKPVFS